MITRMRELLRQKFDPIHVTEGDSISLYWDDPKVGVHQELVTATIDRAGVFDEGVLFEGEEDGRRVLGGYLVEKKRP